VSSSHKTFTDPRLCTAIVDRLFAGNIIETVTGSYRLAHTLSVGETFHPQSQSCPRLAPHPAASETAIECEPTVT